MMDLDEFMTYFLLRGRTATTDEAIARTKSAPLMVSAIVKMDVMRLV